MNIKKLNERLENLIEAEYDSLGRSRINFSSFGGSIEFYGDVFSDIDIIEIGLNSSSRGPIVFKKQFKNTDEKEGELAIKAADTQNKTDIKELLTALKPLCDEFDKKIADLLAGKGYYKQEQ